MATYHFQAKVVQSSKERSAAAAYRAAEALYDEKLGRTHNYLAKPGVVHSEILLPAGSPDRWRHRETLWNEVTRQRLPRLRFDLWRDYHVRRHE